MKISIMSHCFYEEFASGAIEFDGFISFCSDIKADGIELSDHHLAEKDYENAGKKLLDAGLELPSYVIVADFVQADEKIMDNEVGKVMEKIDRAAYYGGKHVMVSPGGIKEGLNLEEARKLIIKGLKKVSSYAARKGITLSIENHGGFARLRGKIQHMKEFIDNIPALSLTYDVGNYLMAGDEPLYALKELYGRIVHVHLKDFVISNEAKDTNTKTYKGVPIGEGIVPNLDVIKILKKSGYSGYLSIEYGGNIPPDIGVKRSLRYLKNVLNENNMVDIVI